MKEARSASLLRQILGGSAAAQQARGFDEPELTWRVLVTLNAFRLLIAVALLVLFLAGGEPRIFGDSYPTLFAATAAGYLVFAALSVVLLRQRWAPVGVVGPTQLLADIVAVVLLMHASGGIESGLGGLLIVFLGAGSLALPLQYPVVLAAIATFAVLGQQVFANLSDPTLGSNFPAAGILGGVIFAMALAAQPLARRIQASEALARKFGIDLKNISELNEYIVQHLRESILVIDADDTVRLINSSATQLLGAKMPLPGTPLYAASSSLGDYVRLWRQDTSLTSHPEFALAAEGNDVRVTAHLAPLGKDDQRAGPILIFLEDVSIMNARVQQSKLASLGRLSASIAHEIRNPVGAMSHAAQLLRESPILTPDDRRLTDIIQSHSERVSHIIDNVLQLSRRESSQPSRVLLKTWLKTLPKNSQPHSSCRKARSRSRTLLKTSKFEWTRATCARCCGTFATTPSSTPVKPAVFSWRFAPAEYADRGAPILKCATAGSALKPRRPRKYSSRSLPRDPAAPASAFIYPASSAS